MHAYFTGSGQHSGRLPSHHLDFRAAGGYVLAPPSQVSGRSYQLLKRLSARTIRPASHHRAPAAGERRKSATQSIIRAAQEHALWTVFASSMRRLDGVGEVVL